MTKAKGSLEDKSSSSVQMQLLATQDKAHTIYDINSIEILQRVSTKVSGAIAAGALNDTKKPMFATAGDDGGVKVWLIREE